MDLADRLREAVADRYAVERELGRGGMAVVYLARDLRHERSVAIKVLRPELTVSLVADRFLREIQIAAQLQHPLIVPLYDSGGTDELLWYVMPFVEGETLRERLQRERQLPLEDALRITRDAAAALQCAHEHGVVHRDIKPENILLSGGHAMLADFGIARALTRAAGEGTSSGVAIGTPAYMSPEQAAGGAVIDARSDIYSLGCVLYEMLAGEPPFTGPTPQAVIARHVNQRPPSVSIVRPGVPQPLEDVIAVALTKAPADRYATAREFASALAGLGVAPRPGHRIIRQKWVVVTAALLVSLGVVAAIARLPGRSAAGGEARILVIPFSGGDTADLGPDRFPDRRLAAALEWLRGVRALDGRALVSGFSGQPLDEQLRFMGRSAGAGFVVAGQVDGTAERTEVQISLYGMIPYRRLIRTGAVGPGNSLDRMLDSLALQLGLELARRGVVNLGSALDVAGATRSPRALADLLRGQDYLARESPQDAVLAYQQAIAADSGFGPAYHRLSVAETWRYDHAAALEAVEAGLEAPGVSRAWRPLLEAQRLHVLRDADSAIAAFQRLVLDNAQSPDAWLGLGESLFRFGAYAGHELTDALPAYQSLMALDSAFAPVHTRILALTLLRGDTRAAKEAMRRVPAENSERRTWELAIELCSGQTRRIESALRRLERADRTTISLLFMFLSRRAEWLPLADTVASYLLLPNHTPDDRLRGAQYQLVARAALGRWQAARDTWAAVARGAALDQWIVEAYLAGYAARDLAEPMLAHARSLMTSGRFPDFSGAPDDAGNEAFQALVHEAVLHGDSLAVQDLLRLLQQAPAPDRSDPLPRALAAALRARLSLLGSDTTQAIAQLRSALRRPATPWTAVFPHTSLAPERALLARLLQARGDAAGAEAWHKSFVNSWAAGDLLYTAHAAGYYR